MTFAYGIISPLFQLYLQKRPNYYHHTIKSTREHSKRMFDFMFVFKFFGKNSRGTYVLANATKLARYLVFAIEDSRLSASAPFQH